jgi:hypothetical protein
MNIEGLWGLLASKHANMRVAPKFMPTILLCWSMMSEVDVGDMAVEAEPSSQYSIKFCCRAADDSRGAV